MGSPTIVGEASTTVQATPAEVIANVLDLQQYKKADHKIGRIGAVHRTGDQGTATFSGRLRGLPGPAGTYPLLRRWLAADTAQEMQRFQALVDHEGSRLAAEAS